MLARVFSDEVFFSFSDPTRLIWLDEVGSYFNDTTLAVAFGITTRRRVVRVRKVNPTTFTLDKTLPFLTRPKRWNSMTSGPIPTRPTVQVLVSSLWPDVVSVGLKIFDPEAREVRIVKKFYRTWVPIVNNERKRIFIFDKRQSFSNLPTSVFKTWK